MRVIFKPIFKSNKPHKQNKGSFNYTKKDVKKKNPHRNKIITSKAHKSYNHSYLQTLSLGNITSVGNNFTLVNVLYAHVKTYIFSVEIHNCPFVGYLIYKLTPTFKGWFELCKFWNAQKHNMYGIFDKQLVRND